MARGRKKAETAEGGNVTRQTLLEFNDELTVALREKATADSAVTNVYKRAETAGLDRKTFKKAHADAARAANERHVDHERYCLYMRMLGVPVGEGSAEADTDAAEQPAADGEVEAVAQHEVNKAFEEGVYAGKAGANMAASNSYQPGSAEHQSFSLGWSAGQKEAVEALGGATRRRPASETATAGAV